MPLTIWAQVNIIIVSYNLSMFAARKGINRGISVNLMSKRTVFNKDKWWSRENIPVFGFMIGTTAICFQVVFHISSITMNCKLIFCIKVGVLYPWHETLSVQIDRLEVNSENITN